MQPTPVIRVCYLSPILFDQSSYVISPHPARHKRHGRAVPKYSTVGYSIFKVQIHYETRLFTELSSKSLDFLRYAIPHFLEKVRSKMTDFLRIQADSCIYKKFFRLIEKSSGIC